MGQKPKLHLPLAARGPPSNTLIPRHTPLTTQTTARPVHTLSHNYAKTSPLVTMGCHAFTQKTAPFP